jgi:putative hydrolase of the HAD superfamily
MSIEEFRDLFFSADFLDVELMAFIRSLRPAFKTGLLSNAWDNARQVFTQIFPIADAFDAIVISAEEKVAKPDSHIYRIALERLGVQAGESVFLDDMPENVRGAEAVGMRAVQFQSTEQARREIGQLLGLGG